MTENDLIYKSLLNFGKERLEEYFKNVELFETQYKFNQINADCNLKMYQKIQPQDKYLPRQDFFTEIPGLETECKKCWKYFINPRNKSVKGLDIQLGKLLEEIFIDFFKEKQKINIVRADLKNRRYPDLLILDSSKSIIGYIELKYHAAPFLLTYKMREGRECYEGSLTLDKKKIEKQIAIIYSELDRPVFFVHWVDFPCVKGIFYQTSEQLHDYLLNNNDNFTRKEREGDIKENKDGTKKSVGYYEKIYPSITEMGNFVDLLNLIKKHK